MIHFKEPIYFIFLILIPLIYWHLSHQKRSAVRFSSVAEIKTIRNSSAAWMERSLVLIRTLSFVLIILALARPQRVSAEREFQASGIDIVIALDLSGSMLAEDFKPNNRMFVAKAEAKKFIQSRKSDRIGLVVFAGKSYTQCPLTLDYEVLTKLIDDVEIGMIKDGTAIGLGIANAVNRLRESDGKSKIIILLTDGDNNSGNIDPITAAELAKSFGIKVYTIGIGRGGLVPFPVDDPIFGKRYVQAEVNIDEKTLKRIADITGGVFFPAKNTEELSKIYDRINQLEKSEFKVKEYSSFGELFYYFLYPAFFLMMIEILLRNTLFLKIP